MYLFRYHYNLIDFNDIIKIKKKFNIKKLNLLDFGCGSGSWDNMIIQKEINSLCLYDKNKNLIPILKKKYNSKKIFIEFNKKKIFRKRINLIIFSSVFQYIDESEMKKIFSEILRIYKKKKIYIFINDHPLKKRIIEILMLPFVNINKFFYSISLIFNIEYLLTKYYFHNIMDNKYILENFKIVKMGFVNDMNYLRGKYILIPKTI